MTLTCNEESPDIFKLDNLSQVIIKVQAYRAQTGLTKYYNCQKFSHVWANCKQPPRCVWCEGGHLHKECPEKSKETSTPKFCNCVGGAAADKNAESPSKELGWKIVLFQVHNAKCLHLGGSHRKPAAVTISAATAPAVTGQGKRQRKRAKSGCWVTTCHTKAGSQGPGNKYK
jgi:hypothetical protein